MMNKEQQESNKPKLSKKELKNEFLLQKVLGAYYDRVETPLLKE